ncbi:MAG: motility protein A [Candidatus Binataceae bacterium]
MPEETRREQPAPVKAPRRATRIDVASIIGFLVAPGCVLLGFWLEGGEVWSLFQLSAALIVFGSTLAACLVSFSPFYLAAAVQDLNKILTENVPNQFDLIDRLIEYATASKNQGPLVLDELAKRESYPTLACGIKLIANNADEENMTAAMERLIYDRTMRNNAGAEVFEAAGGYLPTFGILGAVMGLIHTMHTLTDPSRVGIGIAAAFIATVYGVGAANLLVLPIAKKIRTRARAERQLDRMVLMAVNAIRNKSGGGAIRQLFSASDGAQAGREVRPGLSRAA